ncbi:Metallo-beta-lactamase superfamily protein [Spironucleus salmonicida]|uniref:Metallo-beta-lactamase superfamily protein n=1 Tax=Spironucleus salmonicida TaxID=348837 RepID=V6LQY8_9EUKA|nr:Metallo-beta-lactamase superfamily protein [Spironucleus salmonicida]|eukprot:EST46121.1 Metallo-beta-lactamase superfamily protein [Spironucleus salmonicida]
MELEALGVQPINGQSIYLLTVNREHTLLDAGNAHLTPLNLGPLRHKTAGACLVTHAHRDHTGALPQLQREFPDVEVHRDVPFFGCVGAFQAVPSGHIDRAAAFASQKLFYTGDFQTTRTPFLRGLGAFAHADFLLCEASQIALVQSNLAAKFAVSGGFHRQKITNNFTANLNLNSNFHSQNLNFRNVNCSLQNRDFRDVLHRNGRYFQTNAHADYRDIVLCIDAVMPKCVILTHASDAQSILDGAARIRALVCCEVDFMSCKVSENVKIVQREGCIFRVAQRGTLKAFCKFMKRSGILMERKSEFCGCGRNIAFQRDTDVVFCYQNADEAVPFLAWFVAPAPVDELAGFWD